MSAPFCAKNLSSTTCHSDHILIHFWVLWGLCEPQSINAICRHRFLKILKSYVKHVYMMSQHNHVIQSDWGAVLANSENHAEIWSLVANSHSLSFASLPIHIPFPNSTDLHAQFTIRTHNHLKNGPYPRNKTFRSLADTTQ